MTNLYQLTAQYQQLMDKDEYTAEDMAALDALPGLIEDKLIGRAHVIRNLEYLIASINCELINMQSRRDKLVKNQELLQQSILETMLTNNIPKIDKSPHFNIAVHRKKPCVDDYDDKAIPAEYWLVKTIEQRKLDKNRLHDDLAAGKHIPGARLVDPFKIVIK